MTEETRLSRTEILEHLEAQPVYRLRLTENGKYVCTPSDKKGLPEVFFHEDKGFLKGIKIIRETAKFTWTKKLEKALLWEGEECNTYNQGLLVKLFKNTVKEKIKKEKLNCTDGSFDSKWKLLCLYSDRVGKVSFQPLIKRVHVNWTVKISCPAWEKQETLKKMTSI